MPEIRDPEKDELGAYLKAFCRATILPEEERTSAAVGVHEANPTMAWAFRCEDERALGPGERFITGGQIRRSMELVGYDRLKIEPATRTIADDLAETAELRREVRRLRGALAVLRTLDATIDFDPDTADDFAKQIGIEDSHTMRELFEDIRAVFADNPVDAPAPMEA